MIDTLEQQLASQQQQLAHGWSLYEQQINQMAMLVQERDAALEKVQEVWKKFSFCSLNKIVIGHRASGHDRNNTCATNRC